MLAAESDAISRPRLGSTWAPTWAPPLPVASEYPQHVPVSLSLLDDVFISDRRRRASLTQARSFSLRKR